MLISRERRAVREPGASPGRSRRCEGRRSPAKSHWRKLGRRRQREPRVRRPAARRTNAGARLRHGTGSRQLLAEGGIVYRRSIALTAAAVALLVLVPAALAARVHVRVEGKTQTIFGSAEPTLIVKGKRCFFATGRNDAGRASRVRGVVFTFNGRRLGSRTGVVCSRLGRYSVRVAKPGAIRSRTYSGSG